MASRSYEDQSAMREDIRRINLYINGVKEDYTIVDRLGEGEPQFTSRKSLAHWRLYASGTFSSVYKAIDKNYAQHDNRYWEATSQPVPTDEAARKQLEKDAEKNDALSRLKGNLDRNVQDLKRADGQDSKSADGQVWVALKRIYVTSSPDRIYNELDIMEDLRWVSVVQPVEHFAHIKMKREEHAAM
jgi:serine/threonine protein kinase